MKSFKNIATMVREEASAPPMAARSLYTKMYAKHGGTASKIKDAQAKAYQEVEKKHGKQVRDSLESYHNKNMNEAIKDKYDIGEYDQEGDMAKSDLRSIIANAQKLHDMIEDADNLPEWVQSKITKAEDYISTVANYMAAEMNEEVEQIDELSKGTIASYAKKATHDSRIKMGIGKDFERVGATYRKPENKAAAKSLENKYKSDARKREAGVGKAIDRLAKEEVEQIDELSKKTLGSYLKSATHDVAAKGAATRQFALDSAKKSSEQDYDGARKSMQKSDKTFSQSWKRRNNMAKAVDRLTKEEIEQIDEKNVPTSPEKWAQAKSQAKAKFDVYPSAYANGWAAKKYKEMGGGWKSVNEEKNDAPFEGGKPVSSKKSVVPGKYGVGASTAKHLAKTAMKKQSDKMKKPVKEEASPRVKIVKDIMKKKKQESADTFQKDPIISKTEVRM